MRQIGTLSSQSEAKKFADYLLTLNITTRVDSSPSGHVVWVHREERVDEAKRELSAFLEKPDDPKYEGVEQTARALRKQKEKEDKRHIRNSIDLRGRWDYRPAERCPVTISLVVLSIAVFLMPQWNPKLYVQALDNLGINAIDKSIFSMELNGKPLDGLEMAAMLHHMNWPHPVFPKQYGSLRQGQIWRLVTPIFLGPAGGGFPLLFTAFWLYDLGGLVEMRRGSARLALMLVPIAVISNLAEYAATSNPFFGGMSGLVFGLFGYVFAVNRQGKPGMPLRPAAPPIMLGWVLWSLCIGSGHVGVIQKLAGLAVGVALAYVPDVIKQIRG